MFFGLFLHLWQSKKYVTLQFVCPMTQKLLLPQANGHTCRFWVHPSNWWVVLKSTHLFVGFLFKIWMLDKWFNHASISFYNFNWQVFYFVSWGFISLWNVIFFKIWSFLKMKFVWLTYKYLASIPLNFIKMRFLQDGFERLYKNWLK